MSLILEVDEIEENIAEDVNEEHHWDVKKEKDLPLEILQLRL